MQKYTNVWQKRESLQINTMERSLMNLNRIQISWKWVANSMLANFGIESNKFSFLLDPVRDPHSEFAYLMFAHWLTAFL